MSRKVLVAFAAVCVVFVGASFAAVENIKVSGDITATAVGRDLSLHQDESLGGAGGHLPQNLAGGYLGNKDRENFVYSQVRLRFDADLTEGVSAVVRLINERLWGSEDADNGSDTAAMGGGVNNRSTNATGGDTEIDLDLAYIEMKEFLYQPLTLIVGRQNLRYGNALIIGDPDTNQTASVKVPMEIGDQSLRKSFDAVRAVLDYSPYTIDLIYAAVDENETDLNDDRNLWAAYGTYDWASYNGVTEGYFAYVNQNMDSFQGTGISLLSAAGLNALGNFQAVESQSAVYTVGARTQYDPNDNWTIGIEGAYQFGDIHLTTGTTSIAVNPYQHLSAFAAQLIAQYRYLNDYNAMLQLEYTYLSGDDDLSDEAHNGWQPLFEDQTAGTIINQLFPNTGTQCITARGSLMPREDITLGASYSWLALSEKVNYDGTVDWYAPTYGPLAQNQYKIEGNSGYLGSEIDSYMLYDYTEDVQIKMTGATFIPGGWFHSENNSVAYELTTSVSVDF